MTFHFKPFDRGGKLETAPYQRKAFLFSLKLSRTKKEVSIFFFINSIENAGLDTHVGYANNWNHIHSEKCEVIQP